MTGGYLLYSDYWHGYLQFVPYDGSIAWSGMQDYGHVFTLEDATSVSERLPCRVRIVRDYDRRAGQPIPAKAQIPALVD